MKERSGYPIALLIALCLAESTVTFETSMIYAAVPKLIRDFGDPFMAGQMVAVHPLVAAVTAPVIGRIGDLRGRRRVMLWLLAAALAGSLLSAVSTSFTLVLLGRALQGVSVTILPLGVGVLREAMSRERLPMGVGILSTAQGIGSGLGLVLGGAIVDSYDWHYLFVASAVLVAVSLVACWRDLPVVRTPAAASRIDWIEGLLPMPGLLALMVAIGLVKQHGVLSWPVLGLLAVAIAFLLLWARRSLAARDPFINLRLFAVRDYAVANAATFLLAMGAMQIVYMASTYAQSPSWTGVGLGVTAMAAGLAKLPAHGLTITAGPLASWIAMRSGHRTAFVGACALALCGWLYALTLPDSLVKVALLLCIASYGITAAVAATTNIIVDAVPEGRTSEALGTMSVVRSIGLAIGAQLIALSLSTHTLVEPGSGARFPSADSFRLTMAWIAATSLAATLVALLLRRGRRAGRRDPEIEPEPLPA